MLIFSIYSNSKLFRFVFHVLRLHPLLQTRLSFGTRFSISERFSLLFKTLSLIVWKMFLIFKTVSIVCFDGLCASIRSILSEQGWSIHHLEIVELQRLLAHLPKGQVMRWSCKTWFLSTYIWTIHSKKLRRLLLHSAKIRGMNRLLLPWCCFSSSSYPAYGYYK